MANCNCNNANKSIKCSVTQCSHHCGAENYCSLDCITVGTHEALMAQDGIYRRFITGRERAVSWKR